MNHCENGERVQPLIVRVVHAIRKTVDRRSSEVTVYHGVQERMLLDHDAELP